MDSQSCAQFANALNLLLITGPVVAPAPPGAWHATQPCSTGLTGLLCLLACLLVSYRPLACSAARARRRSGAYACSQHFLGKDLSLHSSRKGCSEQSRELKAGAPRLSAAKAQLLFF